MILGISMGGMHSWIWSILYPDFMDGIMPIVCTPHTIQGRNLLWRRMIISGVADGTLLRMMLDGVPELETDLPDIKTCDEYIRNAPEASIDLKYALNASQDYHPEYYLESIRTHVFNLNFSDDEINSTQLHLLEQCMPYVKNGEYVIQKNDTYGHSTTGYPQLWWHYLEYFLKKIE